MALRKNKEVVYDCQYQVVWCTKFLRDVITEEVSERLKKIAYEIAEEREATIVEIETMPDHVQMLVEVDPQYGIHRFVKQVKGRSSRLLRQEFTHVKSRIPTLWTNSYFISTVGGVTLETVKAYVENQRNA